MNRTIITAVISAGLAAAVTFGLTACAGSTVSNPESAGPASPGDPQPNPTATSMVRSEANMNNLDKVTEVEYTLSSGRTVTCLIYQGYSKGGLSCDFDHAKS